MSLASPLTANTFHGCSWKPTPKSVTSGTSSLRGKCSFAIVTHATRSSRSSGATPRWRRPTPRDGARASFSASRARRARSGRGRNVLQHPVLRLQRRLQSRQIGILGSMGAKIFDVYSGLQRDRGVASARLAMLDLCFEHKTTKLASCVVFGRGEEV